MLYSCHSGNFGQLVPGLAHNYNTFKPVQDRQQLHIVRAAVKAPGNQHQRLLKGAQRHRSRFGIGSFRVVIVGSTRLFCHILQPVLDAAERSQHLSQHSRISTGSDGNSAGCQCILHIEAARQTDRADLCNLSFALAVIAVDNYPLQIIFSVRYVGGPDKDALNQLLSHREW
ncbi:hypothetical protein D3C75_744950 [compost metagenome]